MPTVKIMPGGKSVPAQIQIKDKPDAFGGEANVYFTPQYAVKIYKKSNPAAASRLKSVLHLGKDLGTDEEVLAWPLAIVEGIDSRPVQGCVSRYVPSPPHQLLWKLLYSPIDAAEQFKQGRSWVEYLKIARSTAGAIRAVHNRGIVPSDISFNNVLADPIRGTAVLIDLDSLIVDGFVAARVGGTPKFRAPEIVLGRSKINERSDRYAAAILLLWTLLFRNVMHPTPTACYSEDEAEDERLGWGEKAVFSENPRDRRHWFPKIGVPLYRGGALSYHSLTPKLQSLTEQALIEGLHAPEKRPSVASWERALAEAYDTLGKCPACKQSCIYPFWMQPPQARRCAFCGSNAWRAYVSVGELYEPGPEKGIMQPVRPVVLQHGAALFSDALEPKSIPPFTRRGIPVAGKAAWNKDENAMHLVNMTGGPWRVVMGGTGVVQPGQSVALKKGMVVSFGPGKRLLQIKE